MLPHHKKYKYASRFEKTIILNEFIDYSGFSRKYAARALHSEIIGKKKISHVRQQDVCYDQHVKSVLEKLCGVTDHICVKQLVAIIPELLMKNEQIHEFEIPDYTKEKLKNIFTATIDRF